MGNYSGTSANRLINALVVEEGGSQAEMNAKMKNANEVLDKNPRFGLKAGKSEHNHASSALRAKRGN